MKTYRLAPTGRRMILALMVGAFLLWCSALWSLQGALGIDYANLGATLAASFDDGLDAARLIPAGVLLALIVAAPFLWWSLWQEWRTSYTVDDDGLTYRVAARTLHFPWTAIRSVQVDADPEAIAVVVVPESSKQIKNPLSRWLHSQAFGSGRVPIYPTVEQHAELVEQIARRIGANGFRAT